jgi:dUTP pyrophosphatase
MIMKIELKILDKELYNEKLPNYATEGSAAIDLIAAEDVVLNPGECRMIHTGIAIHIDSFRNYLETLWPMYYAGAILPRSGLGHRSGLILGNTIGLIDGDYQGEILVSAWNRNAYDYARNYYPQDKVFITRGDRFAQLMFIPIVKPDFTIVYEFTNKTERGSGGYGSTGK